MKQNKKQALSINASHPFPLRNRCKHCGSKDLVYYYDYTNPYWYPNTRYARDRGLGSCQVWLTGRDFDYLIAYYKRHGIRFDPTHSVGFKRYNPKLSKSWSGGAGRHYISQMLIVLVCGECDMQTWGYMNLHNHRMPENLHRKARINCPEKVYPLQWRK